MPSLIVLALVAVDDSLVLWVLVYGFVFIEPRCSPVWLTCQYPCHLHSNVPAGTNRNALYSSENNVEANFGAMSIVLRIICAYVRRLALRREIIMNRFRFHSLLVAAAAMLIVGQVFSSRAEDAPKVPRFSIDYMDRSVNPAVDFYHFADGNWLKNNPVPEDKSRWAGFDELQERNWQL